MKADADVKRIEPFFTERPIDAVRYLIASLSVVGNSDFARLEEMPLGELLRWHETFADLIEEQKKYRKDLLEKGK